MENAELDVEKLTRDVGMPLFFFKNKIWIFNTKNC